MRKFLLLAAIVGCASVTACAGRGASSSVLPKTTLSQTRIGQTTLTATDSESPYVRAVLATGPIAYYRLNDRSSTAFDSGTTNLAGTYGAHVGRNAIALTSGNGAASALFAGSPAGSDIRSNAMTVASNPHFASATRALTVEAWIRPNALNTTNHFIPIASYGRESRGQAWVLQISPQSTLNFWMKVNSGTAPFFQAKGTARLLPTRTYQVVVTYSGSTLSLYVDGHLETSIVADGTIDYSGLLPDTGLAVGAALQSVEPIFDGSISDVSIYSTALSADVVKQHYATGQLVSVPTPPSPLASIAPNPQAYAALVAASNPVAYYPLNDTGTTMADASGHQLAGVYGVNVRHGGAALTSAQDRSSMFPGSNDGPHASDDTGTVTANPMFSAPGGFTVEAWIDLRDYNRTNAFVPIVSYGRQAIGSAWALELTPQTTLALYFKVNGTPSSYLIRSVQLLPAHAYQVVATYDGSSAKVFLNGRLVGSSPATGSMNYSGFAPQYGLTVGGATGGNAPVFNGAINDVSVYGNALDERVVQAHYLGGNLVSTMTETPRPSDSFVDSIGVVTHLRVTGGPYTRSFPTFEALLKASGIRHIGDALTTDPAWYPAEINRLAADGIHASLITDFTQTPQIITTTIAAFKDAIESVEGPNEPDKSRNPNWVADTRAFQRMLWSTVKQNPATAHLTVLGPSLTSVVSDTALGDLSSYLDSASLHDYFDGYNPGTAGWGSLSQYGVYGSFSYNRNIASIVSGSKPLIATETGYGNLRTDSGGVDDRTLARYAPRLYLEHFLNNVERTTIYEFYDEPGNGNFDDFGLIRLDNTPKASYVALQSLIATLADPGGAFVPKSLNYILAGNVNNVHHLLLQKRDGTYELVMWVETQSYDPNAKTDIPVPEQSVSIAVATASASATVSTIDDTGRLQTGSVPINGGVATVAIDDRVSIVSFK